MRLSSGLLYLPAFLFLHFFRNGPKDLFLMVSVGPAAETTLIRRRASRHLAIDSAETSGSYSRAHSKNEFQASRLDLISMIPALLEPRVLVATPNLHAYHESRGPAQGHSLPLVASIADKASFEKRAEKLRSATAS